MGLTSKTKENNTTSNNNSNTSSSEGWGMGFLFIFFPEDDHDNNNILNKKSKFSITNSSSPSFKVLNTILKRSNSTHLLSRAQSTISICALLIFITLLLFTLSTFEPTAPHHFPSRRHLTSTSLSITKPKLIFPHALQGMGSLYSRGTRAMSDLIVAHVPEVITELELKLFLRLFYKSGITSKSDIIFLFSSKKYSYDYTIIEENNAFLKLIHGYSEDKNHTQFVISSKKEKESGEPIWGRKIKSNNYSEENVTELTRLSYGSVVGFDVDELDPENSLSGFLDHVPLSLRRWACYPMLLGRVRRNFKHVMLVDVKDHLVLSDPLSTRVVKNQSPETVVINTVMTTVSGKKRNVDKTHQKQVNPGIIMGGARGVRRFSNAMLIEIVRVAMQHKKKNSVSESGLFNQLVGNEFILKNVNLIMSSESIPELSSLLNGKSSGSNNSLSMSKFPIVRRGNSNLDITSSFFKKYFCSSTLDSIAYSDC